MNNYSIGLVVGTNTFCDVQWQDGSIDRRVNSKHLLPIYHFIDSDFWPNDFVTLVNSDANNQRMSKYSYGYVKSVNPKERTSIISWVRPSAEIALYHSTIAETKEELCFDLQDFEGYSFQIGDLVVATTLNLTPSSISCKTPWIGLIFIEYAFLSKGEIIKMEEGMLLVQWNDNSISSISPDKVFKLEDHMEQLNGEDDQSVYDDEEEEEEEERVEAIENKQEEEKPNSISSLIKKVLHISSTGFGHNENNSNNNEIKPLISNSNGSSAIPQELNTEGTHFQVLEEVLDHQFAKQALKVRKNANVTYCRVNWED